MHLAERVVRSQDSLRVLEGPGPRVASFWADYRHLGAVLSEQHSTALYMADQAVRRGERNRRFDTDLSQETVNSIMVGAVSTLRKLDKDIQSIIATGGYDAVTYLKALTSLRTNLTGTIEHFQRLVGT